LNVPPDSDISKAACVGCSLPQIIGSSYFDPSRDAKSEHAEYSSTVWRHGSRSRLLHLHLRQRELLHASRRLFHCSQPLLITWWVHVELAEGVTSNLNATSLLLTLRRKLTWGLDHTASGFVGRAGSIGFQQQSAHLNKQWSSYRRCRQSI
jgi:hypothetical protein